MFNIFSFLLLNFTVWTPLRFFLKFLQGRTGRVSSMVSSALSPDPILLLVISDILYKFEVLILILLVFMLTCDMVVLVSFPWLQQLTKTNIVIKSLLVLFIWDIHLFRKHETIYLHFSLDDRIQCPPALDAVERTTQAGYISGVPFKKFSRPELTGITPPPPHLFKRQPSRNCIYI